MWPSAAIARRAAAETPAELVDERQALRATELAAARYGSAGLWWTISLTALCRAGGMLAIWRAGRWQRSSLGMTDRIAT